MPVNVRDDDTWGVSSIVDEMNRHLLIFGFLAAVTNACMATQAADLDALPVPQACTTEAVNLDMMLDARDKGLTKDRALEITAKAEGKDKISPSTIENAYRYPQLSNKALAGYTLWACAATTYGVPALPLSSVEADLDACARRPTDTNCGRRIRNRVWGLPEDFVAKTHAPPVSK